ncbi:MAG: DUF3047 domain-containing protein [Sphingomonadales bacterium]|nr:DUF3047 domain-containing protein [Sphingomonadales bacterium]MDE2568411.1 DUF3047 domain-containing protein [Sphingomonadales bacterium]
MRESKRVITARAATFVRFVRQQRRALPGLVREMGPPDPQAPLKLTGAEADWVSSGHQVKRGERFRVEASGHQWLARPLALVIEPRSTVYVRIGGREVRKLVADDAVYEAWGDGEVEFLTKTLSEFADEDGALLPGKCSAQGPGIGLRVSASDARPTDPGKPADWRHLWRIGDGRIYSADSDDIAISTHGDVGILQREVGLPLTADLRVEWDWLIESLPSGLPEDLAFTHDYLSIAVEFDNGRDLTYMWSAGLPEGHVFRCPLGWWCDRETHWVLRAGVEGLGQWHSEGRSIAADYREALGEPLPRRVERVWLIANSVFQRGQGKARFRKIRVG